MQVIRLNVTIILLLISLSSFCQSLDKDFDQLNARIAKGVNAEVFPDSLATYTFTIQIKVKKMNKYLPVIESTNKAVAASINSFNLLKSMDYKSLMGQNSETLFILPVAITILDSKQNEKIFKAAYLNDMISSLYYYDKEGEEKIIVKYLSPIIITLDKRVYE